MKKKQSGASVIMPLIIGFFLFWAASQSEGKVSWLAIGLGIFSLVGGIFNITHSEEQTGKKIAPRILEIRQALLNIDSYTTEQKLNLLSSFRQLNRNEIDAIFEGLSTNEIVAITGAVQQISDLEKARKISSTEGQQVPATQFSSPASAFLKQSTSDNSPSEAQRKGGAKKLLIGLAIFVVLSAGMSVVLFDKTEDTSGLSVSAPDSPTPSPSVSPYSSIRFPDDFPEKGSGAYSELEDYIERILYRDVPLYKYYSISSDEKNIHIAYCTENSPTLNNWLFWAANNKEHRESTINMELDLYEGELSIIHDVEPDVGLVYYLLDSSDTSKAILIIYDNKVVYDASQD